MPGPDLSGTEHGAGGLADCFSLAISIRHWPLRQSHDNGNVALLVSAADGTVSATYEYGPFGDDWTTAMAQRIFRFSTKFTDNESTATTAIDSTFKNRTLAKQSPLKNEVEKHLWLYENDPVNAVTVWAVGDQV
jgi:hypothetical protein